MDITELTRQAPYLAAIVIIVYAFLQAQAKRDENFLKAQSERDALFMKSIAEANAVMKTLADEVQRNSELVIKHDVKMDGAIDAMHKSVSQARRRS